MISSVAKKFLRLSMKEHILLLMAIMGGIFFSILPLVLPFTRLAFFFGKLGKDSKIGCGASKADKIEMVARTMRRIKRYFPFRFKCLTSALTAKYLLKIVKVESTLYIGVGKSDDKINAHAWLECNGYIVTGKEEKIKFTPVAYYT